MKISFFSEDDYGKVVAKELEKRNYNIQYDILDENTDICFVMCAPSAFKFQKYLKNRWELERFKFKGIIVYNVLDVPTWRINDKLFKEHYKRYKKILESGNYITTISKFTGSELKRVWKLSSVPLFRVFDDKKVERFKKNFPRDEKTIVGISRFVPHKRFEQLIYALANTDWKLILIGRSGHLEKFYKNLASQVNTNLEIYLNPDDKFVIESLCKSTVCIHPSVFEGLSMVPKEALWCGTPVIISDIPVHREFHKDSVTYIKPDDLKDLKEKIKETPINPTVGKELIKEFTVEKATDNVERWLKSLEL